MEQPNKELRMYKPLNNTKHFQQLLNLLKETDSKLQHVLRSVLSINQSITQNDNIFYITTKMGSVFQLEYKISEYRECGGRDYYE
jgi:hypothetical protein